MYIVNNVSTPPFVLLFVEIHSTVALQSCYIFFPTETRFDTTRSRATRELSFFLQQFPKFYFLAIHTTIPGREEEEEEQF